MMGTYAHRLTSLKMAALPRRFIVFSTQPCVFRELGRPAQLIHTMRLGSMLALRRDGVHSWSKWEGVYDTTDGLLSLLHKYSTRREVTWVMCHHLAYQWVISGLGICGAAHKIDVEGYNFSGRVSTARCKIGGKVLHFVDQENYLDKPLAWIASALATQIPSPPGDTDTDSAALDKSRLECQALSDFIMALSRLAGDDMNGAWGWSLGSMAWRSYRSGLMTEPIYVHADEEAIALERAAYIGGRTECRFIGSVRRPIHVVDYNSLYAYCMANEPMPCKLLGVHGETLESLTAGLHNGLLAVASVTVDAKLFDCPYLIWPGKSGQPAERSPLPPSCVPSTQWRRIWGRGTFSTTLCTPELRRALGVNEIRDVGRVAWYRAGAPFNAFTNCWYRKRLEQRTKGRTLEEALCKRILAILTGKFGQHSRDWVERPDVRCQNMTGHWWLPDPETDEWRVYRAIRGCAQVYDAPGEWKHSCPAISAHVTSAARVCTDMAVEIAGSYDCFHYNYDALHVTALGLARLTESGLVHDTELGRLKTKGTYDGGTWRNVRDYTLGAIMAGDASSGHNDDGGNRGKSTVPDPSDLGQIFSDGSDAWRATLRFTPAGRNRYAGRVNRQGWVQPAQLNPKVDDTLFHKR